MKLRHADKLRQKLINKDCVITPLRGVVSRVITRADAISMLRKTKPGALPDWAETTHAYRWLQPVLVDTVPRTGSGVCTWEDGVDIIIAGGGTSLPNTAPETGGGLSMTTTEMVTMPKYEYTKEGSSEFMTLAEMQYMLDNSTFA